MVEINPTSGFKQQGTTRGTIAAIATVIGYVPTTFAIVGVIG
jgi:hypothetical protein